MRNKFFEAEAFSANLQNPWNSVLQYDAEIELLIEDEDDLSAENESNGTFDEKASIPMVRSESLKNTYS